MPPWHRRVVRLTMATRIDPEAERIIRAVELRQLREAGFDPKA